MGIGVWAQLGLCSRAKTRMSFGVWARARSKGEGWVRVEVRVWVGVRIRVRLEPPRQT